MFGRNKQPTPDVSNIETAEPPPLPPATRPGETIEAPPDEASVMSKQANQSAVQPTPSVPTVPTAGRPGVLESQCSMAVRMNAQKAYMAYCENSGNKNFRGEECPPWAELPMEIRSHWCAAVIALLPHLNNA